MKSSNNKKNVKRFVASVIMGELLHLDFREEHCPVCGELERVFHIYKSTTERKIVCSKCHNVAIGALSKIDTLLDNLGIGGA